MECKAVIFDLFETLITEWGHEKYTKNEMCFDIGIERGKFDIYWDENQEDRGLGNISFIDSLRFVCDKCGKNVDDFILSQMADKRIKTKSLCFEYVNPDVYQLLEELKAKGLRLAIISNCSSEEVRVIKQSRLYKYFDQVMLSYEIKMLKPDIRIYKETADLLGVAVNECIFAGDGGSDELEGAKRAGMKPVQAKWYTNQFPHKRNSINGFLAAEEPLDILKMI